MGALFWRKEFGGSWFLCYLCVSIINIYLKPMMTKAADIVSWYIINN